MIFSHLLMSRNYDDGEKKTTGWRNGYEAKLTNIFSTEFVFETGDGKRLKKYKQGGKVSRVVDSVLALKDHNECKKMGRKCGGILKSFGSGKHFIRRNSDAFMTSLVSL